MDEPSPARGGLITGRFPKKKDVLLKIVVLMPNWVGDVAMATPALRALRQKFDAARIVAVMRPYLTEILDGTSWVDEIWPCEHRRWTGSEGFLATSYALRNFKPDVALGLRGSFRATLMAMASGARLRVGVDSRLFGRFLHRRQTAHLSPDGNIIDSEVDRYLGSAALLGCDPSDRRLELRTTVADEQLAIHVLRRLKLPAGSPLVMLNGNAAQALAKKWPLKRLSELARLIVDRCGSSVIINCGPGEREMARTIVREASRRQVVSLADEPRLSFGLLKGLLRRVDLLVSTDSGPRHLAAALGTPVVAVFGSTDPRRSHNYNPRESLVRIDLPCSPCHRYHCPLGHTRCMNDLTAHQVFQVVAPYLARPAARPA